MAVSDSLFGIHATALRLREQRMALLASNIANSATPNYKARDLDFRAALDAAEAG
ncbi:MAG TPA: flagellar basal body protein, partial [Sphingomicrobium sp.]|nr:flagellar basal body protein [Sphingomicrobium sp.]